MFRVSEIIFTTNWNMLIFCNAGSIILCNTHCTYAQSSFKKNTLIVHRLLLKLGRNWLPHFTVKLPLPTRTSKVHFFYVSQAGEIQPDNMLENNIKTVEVRQSFKVKNAYKNNFFIVPSLPLEIVGNSKPQRGEKGREETARVFLPS